MIFIVVCFYSVVAYYMGLFLTLLFITGGTFEGESKNDVLWAKGIGVVFAVGTFVTNI
jgi:hypothetical protein